MSENFIKATGNKQQQYNNLLPQIAGIVEGETDLIANLANITAMLKEQFNWLWVGFYWVKENTLVLGPFQGPIACTRIQKGKGVCGTAWQQANTVIVADVNAFPGHIACSSLSQSEIVVPIIHKGEVVGVLDVDADTVKQFDETDKLYLEQIVQLIPLS
jgi:L-methionine (R)-S-oxide reductase